MLIIALVLAVIGLAALVTAVVTSNELIAWVCIAASVLGVLLLIIDAIRERQHRDATVDADAGVAAVPAGAGTAEDTYQTFDSDYPDDEDAAPGAPEPVVETAEATAPEVEEPVADVAVDEVVESTTVDSTVPEGHPDVHYVTSDESDSAMEIHYEGESDPESAIVEDADGSDKKN